MSALAETFEVARRHHHAGGFAQAEQLYRQVLQADPGHAECHHMLGVLAFQTGRYEDAVISLRHALALDAARPTFHSNLGVALDALGQWPEAAQSYRAALGLDPGHAETHNNLANLLQRHGKLEDAAAHCRAALQAKPGFAQAHNNLGTTLASQGNLDQAIAQYELALRSSPDFPEAHNNLGNAWHNMGKVDQAIVHYQTALRLRPGFSEAWTNLGNALRDQRMLEAAAHCYRQALQCKPGSPEAFNNLGNVLSTLGRTGEAIDCYREALRMNPALPEVWCNLANSLRELVVLDEAEHCYEQAIRLQPNLFAAINNLGNALLKKGRPDLALQRFRQALALDPLHRVVQSNVLLCLNYDPDAGPDQNFQEHVKWGLSMAPKAQLPLHANASDPERRLRVGYVSPDLRRHALARYVEPVLNSHDSRQVEVHCYAEFAKPDVVSERLRALVHGWRWTCGISDAQLAGQIREDGVDILVDLAGHTGGNRLGVFALKPAPVQVSWLGYLNTTGLASIDYRLTDDILDPPGQPVRDTEELWRLPGGFCCFWPPADAPDVVVPPALNRAYLTFGSLHSLFKLNARVYDLWCEVLREMPSSRLLLFRETLIGEALDRVRREFVNRGIAPWRLELRQAVKEERYLKVYDEIDVSLDAFPWTGGVTTCESLWMGVPVLSLRGVRPPGRNSAALLARVELSDWAVDGTAQFVAKARQIAGDLDQLASLRTQLRQRMKATLHDAMSFTRQLEAAYREMWRRWCAGKCKP